MMDRKHDVSRESWYCERGAKKSNWIDWIRLHSFDGYMLSYMFIYVLIFLNDFIIYSREFTFNNLFLLTTAEISNSAAIWIFIRFATIDTSKITILYNFNLWFNRNRQSIEFRSIAIENNRLFSNYWRQSFEPQNSFDCKILVFI